MRETVKLSRRSVLSGLGAGSAGLFPVAAFSSNQRPNDAGDQPSDNGSPLAYVTFEMQVSWSTTIALQTFIADLAEKGVTEIHLLISSTGGDVSAAVSCYNFLRAMDLQLFTYNLGDVDSAAIMLFLAGRKRDCSPASRFLFHQASAHIHDQDVSYSDFKDRIADLQSDIDRIKAIYATGTKIDDKKAEELLARQNWIDAKTARDLGVVDGIESLRIPRGARVSVLPVPDD